MLPLSALLPVIHLTAFVPSNGKYLVASLNESDELFQIDFELKHVVEVERIDRILDELNLCVQVCFVL